jgi:hypothetical protein
MPVFDKLVAEYRYFVADLLSNAVIAELPFEGVSYERAIKGAGSFSGTVPVIDKTAALSLYENTLPGKTALYVVRNGLCVWGGIIWSRSYSSQNRDLSVTAAEFTSYFYHRNIWKTYSHSFPATLYATGGTVVVQITNGTYPFIAGMPVKIDFDNVGDWIYNGTRTVAASPAPQSDLFTTSIFDLPTNTYNNATVTVRVDTYDYVRRLIDATLSDFVDVEFPNDEIEPAKQVKYTITNKVLTDNVATVTTSTVHGAVIGQVVDISNVDATFNGSYKVTATTDYTLSYGKTAGNVVSTPESPITTSVLSKSYNSITRTAYLLTPFPHGFVVNDVVVISGVDDPTSTAPIFDGTFRVTSVLYPNQFSYLTVHGTDIGTTDASGTATVVATPTVSVNTYGPFQGNADFGLDYSTEAYSGVAVPNATYRGFELRSVGEELDKYSDTLNGFEYRIDCSYDPDTYSFKRTFVLMPINFPNPPPAGEVSPITRFGAQNLVFEFPGNISDVSIDESAEDAATRFFVIGNDSELGQDASQPYAVASATDLLRDGWPLLDHEQSKNDLIDEDALYDYAKRYLGEFRPPVSDIKVSVNGSLDPIVGSYSPGDWCCLIIDDYFVQQRLASSLEPRPDLLVRKIESIKVSVPNNPSFPEQVELGLITEWEVDKVGE